MKKLTKTALFFIIVFIIPSATFSQNPLEIISSIEAKLDTMDNADKGNAYIDIATQYQFVQNKFDSVSVYANKALGIAEEINSDEIRIRAYYYLAMAEWYGMQDYDRAKQFFNLAKEKVIENNVLKKVHQLDNAIASVYMMEGDYENALIQFQKAMDGAIKYKDYETVGMISTNMAIIHNNNNDTLQAIAINEEGLRYLAQTSSPQSDITTVGVYINLTDLYRRTKQMDKADQMVKLARSKVDSMGMFRQEDRLILAEAQLMEERKEYAELDRLLEKHLSKMESNSGYDSQMYTSLLYHNGKSEIRKNNIRELRLTISKLESYINYGNVLHRKTLLEQIYDLKEGAGDYKGAYEYLTKYKELSDSLLSQNQKETLLELKEKYNVEQKEKTIAEAEVKQLTLRRKNTLLIFSILGMGLLSLTGYLWYINQRKRKEEKINQIEQKMLALQMNPHFIFNAISSIQNYLFDDGDTTKAIQHLSTFATLMRQMLENSREKFIPLSEELEFLTNYLNLQKLRFDKRFTYSINLDASIDPDLLAVPPLLTQPFVENAIEHGKIYQVENGNLDINITAQEGNLIIQLVDNGVGIDNDNSDNKPMVIKKKSLSIAITNERLSLLSKLMKKKFYLEIKPNEVGHGTTVNLNIPTVSTV